ncbi:hypothetical protein DFH06DRAFT_1302409 [Mycena polygramma]|nr:hypothetical protein DFH06DRAFT_1302409 [Mycena polygramma]
MDPISLNALPTQPSLEPTPSAWDALLSVQKENTRLRQLLAAARPVPKTNPARVRLRVGSNERGSRVDSDEDELASEEEGDGADGGQGAQETELLLAADQQSLQIAQQRIQSNEARLSSITNRLKASMKILEADKAQLLDAQQKFDEERGQFAAFHAQVTSGQAQLESERSRSKRQLDADARQNANRMKEAEKRVNAERCEVKQERARLTEDWGRLADWKAQFDREKKELDGRRAKLDAGTRWFMDENAILEVKNARLEQDNLRLLDLNKSLVDSNTRHFADATELKKRMQLLLNERVLIEGEMTSLTERARLAEASVKKLEADGQTGAKPHLAQDTTSSRPQHALGPQSTPRKRDAAVTRTHRTARSLTALTPLHERYSKSTQRANDLPPSSLYTQQSSLLPRSASPCMPPSPPTSSPGPQPSSPRKRSRTEYERAEYENTEYENTEYENTASDENRDSCTPRKMTRHARKPTTDSKAAPMIATTTTAPLRRTPLGPVNAQAQPQHPPPAPELDVASHYHLLYRTTDNGGRVRCRLCIPGTQGVFAAPAAVLWVELTAHAWTAHPSECAALLRLGPAPLGEWRGRLGLPAGQ